MTTQSDWKAKGSVWLSILAAAEVNYGIPKDLLARVCYQESRFNPAAKSPAGAVGIMQLEPGYFKGAGGSPAKDIYTAGEYLGETLWGIFKDWQLSLAAYNWGPGNVKWWVREKKRFADMPRETQNYVIQITADVPVKGVLWEVPTLIQTTSPMESLSRIQAGSPQSLPSAAPASGLWWHSFASRFTTSSSPRPQSAPSLQAPSLLSSAELQDMFSKMVDVGKLTGETDMTNQVLTTLEIAAIPTAIAALKAVQQFETDLGPDPTKWVLTALAAKVKLLSSLQLLVAPLGAAEGAAGLGLLTSVTDGWIGTLQSKLNAAPAASTPAISGIGGANVS